MKNRSRSDDRDGGDLGVGKTRGTSGEVKALKTEVESYTSVVDELQRLLRARVAHIGCETTGGSCIGSKKLHIAIPYRPSSSRQTTAPSFSTPRCA